MGSVAWIRLALMVAASAITVGVIWLGLVLLLSFHSYVEGLPL